MARFDPSAYKKAHPKPAPVAAQPRIPEPIPATEPDPEDERKRKWLEQRIQAKFPGAHVWTKAEMAADADQRAADEAAYQERWRNPQPQRQWLSVPLKDRPRYFENAALASYDLGWMPMPQTRERERKPCWDSLTGSPQPSILKLTRPDRDTISTWSRLFTEENLAYIFGPSTGTVGIDVDVSDPVLSGRIIQAIRDTLGYTPFIRARLWKDEKGEHRVDDEGGCRVPRIAFVYRVDYAVDPITSKAYKFVSESDETALDEKKQMVEILGSGRALTGYGTHHRTCAEFFWPDKSPVTASPAEAPLVTREMIGRMLDAVHAVRKIHGSRGSGSQGGIDQTIVTDFRLDGDIYEPWMRVDDAPWTYASGGLVVDGRDDWMLTYTLKLCTANPGLCLTDEGKNRLTTHANRRALAALATDEKRGQERILRDVGEKMSRTADKVALAVARIQAGEDLGTDCLCPIRLVQTDKNRYTTPSAQEIPRVRPGDGSLDWLGTGESVGAKSTHERNRSGIRLLGKPEVIEGAKKARALITDRKEIAAKVSAEIDAALEESYEDIREGKPVVNVLPPPTGSGKTVKAVESAVRYCQENPRREKEGPVAYLLPAHANIDEAREIIERVFRDAVTFPDPNDFGAFAKAKGVKAMVYQGMIRAKCQRADMRTILNESGIAASGLCRSLRTELGIDGDRDSIEEICPFRDTCPAIQMQKDAAIADMVFAPHWYLTAPNLPVGLKNARAVFADENVCKRLTHTVVLPLSSLKLDRAPPTLTKKEKEAGLDPEWFILDRYEAVKVVLQAWADRACPARWMRKMKHGRRWVASARTVCGRAQDVAMLIHANMGVAEIKKIAGSPKATDLLLEYRFWTILLDAMDLLDAEKSKGDRDYRFQAISVGAGEDGDGEKPTADGWRVSWRTTPNWSASPWVILDASANEKFIRKLFEGSEVKYHNIKAPLNIRIIAIPDRTYSTSSLVPGENASNSRKKAAADLRDQLHQMISLSAAHYGDGKVVVGTTKKVRSALFDSWDRPANVEHGNFGGFAGIDRFKGYSAAIGIGRMELPLHVLDGLAAALTYDDDVPEEPYDKRGDGMTTKESVDGKEILVPLFRAATARTVMMRSGHNVTLQVPEVTGEWGRILDEQTRDEEMHQFLGRLRPVFRTDTPVALVATSCVPRSVIVDEMLSIDDLLAGQRGLVWDSVRRAKGVVDPDVTPILVVPEPILPQEATPEQRKAAEDAMRAAREVIADAMRALLDRPAGKMKGFTPIVRTDDSGVAHRALVASWTPDIEGVYRRAWASSGGFDEEILSLDVGEPNHPVMDLPARIPDALQLSFGSEDDILWREEQSRSPPG